MEPSNQMPVLFIGHGSPMNAIETNFWSQSLCRLGPRLPVPKAILAISAHWQLDSLRVTSQASPETIHDFGGFPRELFEMRYPAPGSLELAGRVAGLLSEEKARAVDEWGLDHGTWSVLVHLFPNADIPVVQLSLDARLSAAEQVSVGQKLAVLRREGVLILASGNVTHNLGHAMRAMATGDVRTPDWASSFDAQAAQVLRDRDTAALCSMDSLPEGRLAHPSNDHWLPLLVAYGASSETDALSFPVEGFDLGSLSMRSVCWSPRPA